MGQVGRKPRPFVFEGKHINGLRRRKHDGRWILSDGGTFTESDAKKAVARFYEMTDATVEGIVSGIHTARAHAAAVRVRKTSTHATPTAQFAQASDRHATRQVKML